MGGTFINYNIKKSEGIVYGKTNVISQIAKVNGGLRFISEDQKKRARNKMKAIVEKSLPNTSSTISFTDSYPAMGPTPGNIELLKQLSDVSVSLNQGEVIPYDPGKRGAADISFVANYVDALDGLGTMGEGAHTPEETVNLKTMEALITRTAIFIHRLINSK